MLRFYFPFLSLCSAYAGWDENHFTFMQQQSFPLLTTERVLLRQLQPSDDEAIFALRNNTQVNAYIQRPLPNDINDARYFITSINEGIRNEDWLYWAMTL